jgi:hypothetical protein
MAKHNISSFWLKRILVMLGVIASAIAFLLYIPDPSATSTLPNEPAAEEKSVADSVSRFYTRFKTTSDDPIKQKYGNYTILLDDPADKPLGNAIEEVSQRNFRPLDDWEGAYKQRGFTKDSTLMKEAIAHGEREGYKLVWDLGQDFIVRERFVSENTYIGMLDELAGAIDANFNEPISVYFCFKKRAMVITTRESNYLRLNCIKSEGSFQEY